MLIEENTSGDGAAVTAYSPGRIEINGRAYTEAVALKGDKIEKPGQALPSEITADYFFRRPQTVCPKLFWSAREKSRYSSTLKPPQHWPPKAWVWNV